ncbi:hypothetical protein ACP4OV_013917 [Aristida adscensionis]
MITRMREMALVEPAAAAWTKRRWVDRQGGQRKEPPPPVHISALPDDVRLRILQHLPLRDAIRTAALAQGWRRLWESRWAHPTSCRDVRLLPGDHPAKPLRSLDPDVATASLPPRRLDRFSLVVVGNARLRPQHLRRFLAHAAPGTSASSCPPPRAPLPPRRRRRHHLLRRRAVLPRPRGHRLRTLDLRSCVFPVAVRRARSFTPPAMASLRSLTVAECRGSTNLYVNDAPRLRSFRYSGNYGASPFQVKQDALLTHLYICLRELIPDAVKLNGSLPKDLSGLTVLTICSNALRVCLDNGD